MNVARENDYIGNYLNYIGLNINKKGHLVRRWPLIFRATNAVYRVGESNCTPGFGGNFGIDIQFVMFHDLRF